MTAPEQPTPEQVERITSDVAVQFKCFGIGSDSPGVNPIGIALAEKPACFAMGVDVADVVRFILQHPAAAQRAAEAMEPDTAAQLQRSVEWFDENGNALAEAACRRALAKAATPPPGDADTRATVDMSIEAVTQRLTSYKPLGSVVRGVAGPAIGPDEPFEQDGIWPPGDAGERALLIGGTHLCGHGHMAVMCRICPVEKERDEARAALQSERTAAASQAHPDGARAYAYLQRLLATVAPQCKPAPDLIGLCTQIDSVIVWVKEQAASQARREGFGHGWRKATEDAAIIAGAWPTLVFEAHDDRLRVQELLVAIAKKIRALATPQESAS